MFFMNWNEKLSESYDLMILVDTETILSWFTDRPSQWTRQVVHMYQDQSDILLQLDTLVYILIVRQLCVGCQKLC